MDVRQPQPDLDQLLLELADPDPLIRQQAAIALGDVCRRDHPAIDVLIERLQSSDQSLHDRASAAWALARIGASAGKVVPILMGLIETLKDQADADELRNYAAEAVERLTDDMEVLLRVVRLCLRDRFWKCRMSGLFIAERLVERDRGLLSGLIEDVQQLVNDELEENRAIAQQILKGFDRGVYRS